jgi:carnitine O-acetyltransferase
VELDETRKAAPTQTSTAAGSLARTSAGSLASSVELDETGKASFDHIYTEPDPRPYFATLRRFDYRIPQEAAPWFAGLVARHPAPRPTVLDIGCSYGINAALLNGGVSMEDLYGRYAAAAGMSRAELAAADRALVASGPAPARFVGLDASGPALAYAVDAGLLAAAVHADLEEGEPTEEQAAVLGSADLVVSTGCFGYVTDKTLGRVLDACGGRRPWMAHVVLRMFSFAPVAENLAELGYETVQIERPFRQRRFATAEERSQVLDALVAAGVDPGGLESDGWLYATLHVSRPRGTEGWTVVDLAPGAGKAEPTAAEPATAKSRTPAGEGQSGGAAAPAQSSDPAGGGGASAGSREPVAGDPVAVEPAAAAEAERGLGTFDNEDSLPRVPLPTLEASCARFLEWCGPLLTAEELAATRAAVEDFLRPDGPARVLQSALASYDASPGVHSWLDTFWPYRYLGRRDRIALNANFFFLFQDSGESQVDRAAGLVAAALRYKQELDAEALPPVLLRGQPQSMDQYHYLFATTRIPGPVQDTVRAPYSAAEPGPARARHIAVLVRGNLFRLDVLDPSGRPHSLDDLAAGLRAVRAAGAEPGPGVGSLTSKARAEWACSREALLAAEPANAAALDTVETALFCVCLEDDTPAGQLEASDLLLHGDSGNRWFDKAVSLVVFADGTAGINVEHCELDGTTILSFVDALLSTPAAARSAASGAVSSGVPAFAPITFALTDELRADVAAAAAAFTAYGAATATTLVSFPDFGSTRAKQLRTSPDAFAQMAYQLAHQRAKGHLGATYESIATRHWRHGRTEAMRVVTPQVQAFVAAMQDPAATAEARRAAYFAAAEAHVARAKQCQAGDAPEQHLWELQLIQRRRGAELGVTEPLPLYDSPGWTIMRDDYLSTSSAPSVNIQYFGFGSTSQRCIGIGYVLLPDRLNIFLSTPAPVADQMHLFADHLRATVTELVDLLS